MDRTQSSYRSPTYYELSAPAELDWRPFRGEDYKEYRLEWERRGKLGNECDFPLHLDFDPTNRCNLRCSMCPRTIYLKEGKTHWAPKGLGDMDIVLYKGIIEHSSPLGLKSVKLNFLGEPLMYPKICEMISIAREHNLYVMINTNAVLLDESMSHNLLNSGLTDIFFSFDSPYPSVYEDIRKGASFERTIHNIRRFMEIKDSLGKFEVQTRASMVLPEDTSFHREIKEDYIKLFRDLGVAEIGFGLPTVVGRNYQELNLMDDFSCPDLFRRLFVFYDGIVGPCCGDWERRLIMGDANKESIYQIWNSEAYKRLRDLHKNKGYKNVPACRDCSVPYLSQVSV
jgi:MoaA/NifB/PqqE/SkfB family radical SAM enzyme